MSDRLSTKQPLRVSEATKQSGEIYDRWPWVEAAVWTPRMLTALETGIKGGKWFSLIERWPNAYFEAMGLFNLEAAHARDCQSLPR